MNHKKKMRAINALAKLQDRQKMLSKPRQHLRDCFESALYIIYKILIIFNKKKLNNIQNFS